MNPTNEPLNSSCPDPRTRREKLRNWLFPAEYCELPDAPPEWKDCIHGTTVCKFTFIERLKILLTGIIVVHWRTVTQHEVGKSVTKSTAHVGTSNDWKT